MLGHQSQIEEGKILGVGILDGNELCEHVLGVGAQGRVRGDRHETLEAFEEDCVGSVLNVSAADFRTDAVVGCHKDLAVVFQEVRAIRVLLQGPQEF